MVRHGGNYTVRCESSTGDAPGNMKDIFWRVGRRQIPGGVWEVKNQTDWDLTGAECVARFAGIGECRKAVDVTLYSKLFFLGSGQLSCREPIVFLGILLLQGSHTSHG